MFVSMSLCPKFTAFEIIDDGCNNSDHNPIVRQLEWSNCMQTRNSPHKINNTEQQCLSHLCWDRADILLYRITTYQVWNYKKNDVPTRIL